MSPTVPHPAPSEDNMSATPASSPRVGLFFSTLGTHVPDAQLVNDRLLLALLVDDCCWRIAKHDWLKRRPRRWRHRQITRWIDEHAALAAESQRINALAQYSALVD
jgi:hypothetical protein